MNLLDCDREEQYQVSRYRRSRRAPDVLQHQHLDGVATHLADIAIVSSDLLHTIPGEELR